MRNYFRGKDGLTSLHVGLTVMAFAAVVGLIALDAGHGKVMPDELAAEQATVVAEAPSPAPAAYIVGKGSTARDPSVPADATSNLRPPGTRRRLRRSETQRSRENAQAGAPLRGVGRARARGARPPRMLGACRT